MYICGSAARMLVPWRKFSKTIVSCSCDAGRYKILASTSNRPSLQTLRTIAGSTGICSSRWSNFKRRHILRNENIWTVPNLLSGLRLCIAPVLGYLVIHDHYVQAFGLFVVAGITDLADGWIARVVPGQSSMLGSFLDPMADKVLVGILYISLTYGGLIPLPLTALVISRDVALMGAAAYIRYLSVDPPRTFAKYFNLSQPTAQLAPTFISKVNTGVQLSLVAVTLFLASEITSLELQPYLIYLWYTAGATTLGSAISYIFARNTYTFLKSDPKLQRARDLHRRLFKERGNKNGRS